MCGSMADIQSATAEIRRGKKKRRKKKNKRQDENIMVCPIPEGDHNKLTIYCERRVAIFWKIGSSVGYCIA